MNIYTGCSIHNGQFNNSLILIKTLNCVQKVYTYIFPVQQWATFARSWFLIDARMQPPGKLATMCAVRLQGKHKPIYHALSE